MMYNIINYREIILQNKYVHKSYSQSGHQELFLRQVGPFKYYSMKAKRFLGIDFLRFQYPYDYSKPTVNAQFPGPNHQEALETVQSYNLDQVYQVSGFFT